MSESATKIKPTTIIDKSNRKRTPSSTTRTQKTPSSTVKLLVDSIVKGLEFVRFGIPANPTHPILSNVLMCLDKELQQVRLTSNTLEFSTTFTLEGKISDNAKIALPINAFQQIVKKLSPGEIQLRTNIGNPELEDTPLDIQLLVIGDRSTKFNFRGINTQSFPLLSSNNLQPIATIKAKTLIHQLGTSVFAALPKDGQRILQGTHLIFSRDTKRKLIQLETWTTNGSCLALTRNYFNDRKNKLENPISLTVPSRVLQILKQTLNPNDEVEIYLDTTESNAQGDLIEFRWDNKQLTSRTIEGNFPNCSELVEKFKQNYCYTALVDRQNLLSTLERFSVIADKKTDIVKLVLDSSEQKITLIIDNKEVAKGIEIHRAKIDGDNSNTLEILFNIKYLTRVIKTIQFDTIYLKLGSPTSPVIIEPASQTSLRTEHLLALAPIGL